MKFQYVTSLLLSTVLVGCNDDVAKNRNETNRPSQIAEENVTTFSGIFRNKGTPQVTYKTETARGSEMNNLRSNPDIRFDDDGRDGKNVASRTDLTRPSVECGLLIAETLAQKITDCVNKNGSMATWDGAAYGTSGESAWNLVSLVDTELGKSEIWYDQRTQMIWSDIIAREVNWCQAAGSELPSSDNVGINCLALSKGQNHCGDLNLAEMPKAKWRLPTRNDFLQGDLDGLRFVLNNANTNTWTATVSTDVVARNKAWTYNMSAGNLIAEEMNLLRPIRCIGTANF